MSIRKLFQFRLRAALILLTVACLALWWFATRPRERQRRQMIAGREKIHERDRLYSEFCYDETVSSGLVTVLGDSRMSHWGRVRWLHAPDQDTVVSYGADHALLVWNRDDGSIRKGFYDVTFATRAEETGDILLGDATGRGRLWSMSTGKLHELPIEFPAARSPVAWLTLDAAFVLHAEFRRPISIWNCETGERIGTIADSWAWEVGIVSNQTTLVLGDFQHLKEYDIASAQLLRTFELPLTDADERASPNDLALSRDGNTLYLADAAGRVFVFDWTTHTPVSIHSTRDFGSIYALAVRENVSELYVGFSDLCARVTLSESNQLQIRPVYNQTTFAITDSALTALGLKNGRIAVLSANSEVRLRGGPRVDATCFAYSPTGDRIALASRDGQVVIRTTERWERIDTWKAHTGEIRRIVWSPRGDQLATLGGDNILAIWDAENRRELYTRNAHGGMEFRMANYSNDGSQFVFPGRTRDDLIDIYEADSFSKLTSLPRGVASLRGNLVLSPDKRRLYTGGSPAKVHVWDMAAKQVIASMGGRTLDEVKLALNRSGDTIYAVDVVDIEAFDTTTFKRRWLLKSPARRSFDISLHPQQSILAVGTNEGTVLLIDASTGKLLKTLRFGPTGGEIWQVDFSPDGALLTVAASNGSVVVMQMPNVN